MPRLLGLAQARILHPTLFGQSQARIKRRNTFVGQARAYISVPKLLGQSQAIIRAPKRHLYDTFSRSLSSTWGTPNIGPTYTNYQSQSVFNVDGSFGTVGSQNALVDSPISAFNQSILIKMRVQNVQDLTLRIYCRATNDLVNPGDYQDLATILTFNHDTSTQIDILEERFEAAPLTVTDGSVVWTVQFNNFDGWPADSSSDNAGSISHFSDRFWFQSGTGNTGLVEPNWNGSQPIADGDLSWTQVTSTTWASTTAYSLGVYVEPTIATGYIYLATTGGTSGSTEPIWPFPSSWNETTIDNDIRWYPFTPPNTWNSVSVYGVEEVGFFGAGFYWIVTASVGSNQSGAIEPDWSVAGPITDGDITWTQLAVWQPSTSYANQDITRPTVDNTFVYFAGNSGTSDSTEPSPWAIIAQRSFTIEDSETSNQFLNGLDNTITIFIAMLAQDDTFQVKVWDDGGVAPDPGTYEATITGLSITQPGFFEFDVQGMDAFDGNFYQLRVDEIGVTDTEATSGYLFGQAAARIFSINSQLHGQAQARISRRQLYAQSQASITRVIKLTGQSRAVILNPLNPQTPVVITGSGGASVGTGPGGSITTEDIQDLGLPGYLQSETLTSDMSIIENQTAFSDGSRSEYTGLSNKTLTLDMLIWSKDYADCKNRLEIAASMLRTRRDGFLRLFLHDTDKYYEVLVRNISYDQTADKNSRILQYSVDLELRPWLISNDELELTATGAGTISTAGRTYDDGGWTPTIVTVTGTDITITGYTATGLSAGLINVTGSVTNLVIDTEAGVALLGGEYRADIMNPDFSLYIGPGVTSYDIAGATAVSIKYHNRWYL